jgi:non-specific serine/threonine protein kinase/serine/threonine-protein kinase
MKTQRWERTKEMLEEALRLAPDKRQAYLDAACGPDGELRSEVESLIGSHEAAGSQFLGAAAAEILEFTHSTDSPQSRLNQVIGHYRLVEEIGRGGMGQVWLAEQTAPVRRQVALKLIKAGMFDDEMLKRFQLERQSLAIMDHPAIAKVFDAGATPDGQPYFVMEYVPGVPITDYCDQKRLTIGDRLELLIKVCEAVQHAHQKAIIHRDLKPANILVQEVDGKPVPRIIDFGLAKATSPQIAGESLYTHLGSFVGTPGYMSPEQCDRTTLDVDTRSDVYSLGVVLYVLLTGCLPFQAALGKEQPLEEMLRLVREEDPPRPSTKVSTERETSTATAEARGTEPRQLVGLLRGDLDWITMKALEKDRSRRYGTASELAADVAHYLNHEPVRARPARFSYRLRKYVRRHRVGVAVATGLVILLAGFAVAQAVQLRRITRERDRADRIADFMTGMFKVSNPAEKVGNAVTAREVLDKAVKDIDTGLSKDPELQARMMYEMGLAYLNLGLYSRAQTLFEGSIRAANASVGPENPRTLKTTQRLAWTLFREGKLAEADAQFRKLVATERRVLGPQDPETVGVMGDMATILHVEGHLAEAEKVQREVLEAQNRLLGPEAHYALISADNLASIMAADGRLAEAEKLEKETLDTQRRVYGSENLTSIHFTMNYADIRASMGDDEESEKLLRRVLDVERRILGPHQPETAMTVYDLAGLAAKHGRIDEAISLLREAIEIGLLPRVSSGMEEDSDLKPLRGDPRFAALVAQAKERAAAQKAN